jgi:hypothetical protein
MAMRPLTAPFWTIVLLLGFAVAIAGGQDPEDGQNADPPAAEQPGDSAQPNEPQPDAKPENPPAESKPEDKPETVEVNVEAVLTDLDNPCGLAIQPGTGHVFVSESGAGRILRFDPATRESEPVVTDLPTRQFEDIADVRLGPLALAFIDRDTLIVGCGGSGLGADLVRVYTVPEWGKSIGADETKQRLGPLAAEPETASADGQFFGLTLTKEALYVAASGDEAKGWIARARRESEQFAALERFIPAGEAAKAGPPVALTVSPRRRIVAGQIGELGDQRDSRLTFYSTISRNLLMDLRADLFDLVELAYSPQGRGLLYGVDFAFAAPGEGGVFRLDDDGRNYNDPEKQVKLLRIVSIDRPTSLVFAADGTLYVAAFGVAEEGVETKPGKLVRISGKERPL